jgi:hypothetical protein
MILISNAEEVTKESELLSEADESIAKMKEPRRKRSLEAHHRRRAQAKKNKKARKLKSVGKDTGNF